ncbi:hypothetical protein P9G84_22450 [Brevibacillus centrosporus]|uniref:hypothetical protein n=1 Tax=Brevibacillus centrosporus TaxID=54910 RepID=UPI000F0A80F5|nr:hypothetical protein [Brevibacillus centrosporus]MEC2131690.1 hypothetical protein [Brevibacillus centrosporus]RNB67336.1 hypothetical protein EDM55_20025 [Brevibacillus centrosporus]GED34015.1 hypothetical protein BCE02nite_51560 [Brevibacillus centrosporus]
MPSEVITYKLSPVEMAKLLEGDKKSMGAATKSKRDLTKDVYLKLVKQGMIDSHIRKEYGISNWRALKRLKDAWGIAGDSGASKGTKAPVVPAGVTLEQVMTKLNEVAAEQAETKKQLNGIHEILTQLTQKINSPVDQYIQNGEEKSNSDNSAELIRALLKELL